MLPAQPYIPWKTLTGRGENALLMTAGSDTAGHLRFAGIFDHAVTLGGVTVTSPWKRGIFAGSTDSTGTISYLKEVAGCDDLCDLQASVMLPDGRSFLWVTFRHSLQTGDSLYRTRGGPAMVRIALDARGDVVTTRRVMERFMGRVLAAVADSAGRLWLGGWFRKMEMQGKRYRACGGRDAFLISCDAGGGLTMLQMGGAGGQEVDVLMPCDSGQILLAGSFSEELVAAGARLSGDDGRDLFLARGDTAGVNVLQTVAHAEELTVTAACMLPGGEVLLAGGFTGRLTADDTLIPSKGYEDGYLLTVAGEKHTLLTAGGAGNDRITGVSVDRRGRVFLAGMYHGRMTLGNDTLVREDREGGLFLAETDGRGHGRWLQPLHNGAMESLSFLASASDLLQWAGGNCHSRTGENTAAGSAGLRDGLFLASYIDPCTLLHFDLPGDHYLCAGTTDTLDAGDGYDTYLWMPDGINRRTLVIRDTGTYHVTITDRYGCVAGDSIRVQGDTVRMTWTVEDEVLPEGWNGAVDVTVTSGLFPCTYRWNNGAMTEDLTGVTAGTYSVTVTDSAGCSAIATLEVKAKDMTGIYDLYNYPNPFADVTRILYSLPAGTEVVISIWDVSGKKVFMVRQQASQGIHSFAWARENLKNGVYYLKMQSRFGEIIRKMVIIDR